jgi:uncharacterized surface protein with fasciclin (FAS1) repeats
MRFAAMGVVTAMLGLGSMGCGSMGMASDNGSAMTGEQLSKPDENIVQIATGDNMGEVTTLVKAVQAAGLVDTLQGAGPFTVFAPTNEAFAALPPGTLDDLLKPENKEKLKSILLYHVHPGIVMAKDVHPMKLSTADGEKMLDVTVNGSTVMINDAKVIKTDIVAKNGVIHWIDKVVLPPQ